MNTHIRIPTLASAHRSAALRFQDACREMDRLEGVEDEPADSMFKSDADLSADVSSYFNREG